MRTGRPRAFCVEDALDRAMTVFWRHGYEGASMSDLTAAMGINSPSAYACFGSKEGLFRAVLERYDERRKTFMEHVLAAESPDEMAKRYLHGVAELAADTSGKNPPGCLSLQGGLSCGEERIADVLACHRAEKEKMLRGRLEAARGKGALAKDADPAQLARYLMTVANGICVQATSGASAKELHEVAELALKAWPASRAPAAKKKSSARVSA